MTSPETPPTPASAPWTGTVGGAASACGELATAYVRLWEAIRASAARGDVEEENRLRNQAQAVLGQMYQLHCPKPDTAGLGP